MSAGTRPVRSIEFRVVITAEAIREQILLQTLEEIRGAGRLGELTGKECAELARAGIEAWQAMGGKCGAGS